ncbi:hypothetical protein FQA47_003798 [Oryzias melastigma]|uniref:Uncharacterized protein n=1 Tax=Oryzias melastigma TaxID=30732 RepID=A0A834CPA5_ORYME|nr:hypothetical protein FQA47_003798 [Oryzias melastigma]
MCVDAKNQEPRLGQKFLQRTAFVVLASATTKNPYCHLEFGGETESRTVHRTFQIVAARALLTCTRSHFWLRYQLEKWRFFYAVYANICRIQVGSVCWTELSYAL